MNEYINETKPKTSGLNVGKTVKDKRLDVDVQQTWRFEQPKQPIMVNGKPFNKTSYLFFNFNNIPYNEVKELAKYTMRNPDKLEETDRENDLWRVVYICQDFDNTRQKGTKAVRFALDYFKKKGYIVPSIEELFKNVVTPEQYMGVVQKADEKWVELLSDLGKPETIELVKKYIQRFGKIYMQVYGHQLSFRNAKLILSQKPDASLVMTEKNWMKFFNCTVNPNAQRIIYVGRWSDIGSKTIDDAQRYADTHGIEFDKNKSEYQGHADYGLEIADANSWATCLVVGYDSSDVTPVDENDDWRVTRYGMKNNLTGEPNELTANYYSGIDKELEGEREEYKRLKSVLNDNAKLAFQTIMVMLKQYDQEAFQQVYNKAAQLKKVQANTQSQEGDEEHGQYIQLVSDAVNKLVALKLDRDYKIRRDVHRAAGQKLISGMLLYALGVWDATALSAIGGEKIDKQSVVHYSNILNDILDKVEKIQTMQVSKIKQMVANLGKGFDKQNEPQQYKQAANESVNRTLNEMRLTHITPQQFVSLLDLDVVDSQEPRNTEVLDETLLNEYYDNNDLNPEDFKNPKNKRYSHSSHEEYICGFPVLYQITDRKNIESIFRVGFDREFTGTKAGNVYGPGIYTTYRLGSTIDNLTKREDYGDTIVKMVCLSKFKNYLIFDSTVAKKVYGKDWHISNQLRNLFGEDLCNKLKREGLWGYITSRSEFTGNKARNIWNKIGDENLVRHEIGGFIFRGEYNGYVCVVRDFKSLLPIAYSTDGGNTWNNEALTQDTIDAVAYDVDNRTFVGKDIDKYKDTNKVNSGFNKRINGYILVRTNDGKVNFLDINKKKLSPIDFDNASPFRENGMAYVEITDPKYTEVFGGEFKGYVSKNGIHGTQNMNDCTPWNKFKKYLKSIGVLDENKEYRVRWKVTESENDILSPKKVISENTVQCNTLSEAKYVVNNIRKRYKHNAIEHISIEENIDGEYKYRFKSTNR